MLSDRASAEAAILKVYDQGDLELAEAHARAAVEEWPDFTLGWRVLGAICVRAGRLQEALEAQKAAALLEPHEAVNFSNLGVTLSRLGLASEAVEMHQRAISLAPELIDAWCNLGAAELKRGRRLEAITAFRQALSLDAHHVAALTGHGQVLAASGRAAEAENYYRAALNEGAPPIELLNAYASLCMEAYRLCDAEILYAAALRRDAANAEVRSNRAILFNQTGRHPEARSEAERASQLAPRSAHAWSTLHMLSNYWTGWSPADAAAAGAGFTSALGVGRGKPILTTPVGDEVLRVGLVSGDLRAHPVGYFLRQVLPRIRNYGIEIFVYSTRECSDALSEELRAVSHVWRDIESFDDEAAARLVQSDDVAVLLDLAGHTAHGRLGVFRYRAAPIQASWLGYSATTGLPEMDFFLGDRTTNFGAAPWFSEMLVALPESYLCFSPPDDAPSVEISPVIQNGFITFGCLSNLAKLHRDVVGAWGLVLSAAPTSKLLLKAPQLDDQAEVVRTLQRFADVGVSPNRLVLEGRSDRAKYLTTYGKVDIVLDTFPFPGGTTTFEAFWMGVPVVTLRGERFLEKAGASFAGAMGLQDWIADDPTHYVEIALRKAKDADGLAALRPNLRTRALCSPLFDAENFAGGLAKLLRQMASGLPVDRAGFSYLPDVPQR
jgi:protein O-GlcNAc transferase